MNPSPPVDMSCWGASCFTFGAILRYQCRRELPHHDCGVIFVCDASVRVHAVDDGLGHPKVEILTDVVEVKPRARTIARLPALRVLGVDERARPRVPHVAGSPDVILSDAASLSLVVEQRKHESDVVALREENHAVEGDKRVLDKS
eukprot:4313507-Prymnesium_polylepis.3